MNNVNQEQMVSLSRPTTVQKRAKNQRKVSIHNRVQMYNVQKVHTKIQFQTHQFCLQAIAVVNPTYLGVQRLA